MAPSKAAAQPRERKGTAVSAGAGGQDVAKREAVKRKVRIQQEAVRELPLDDPEVAPPADQSNGRGSG